ncbi:hypothetical protein CRUP_023415, partial [Coryphaenoides rupestris]
CPAQAGFLPLAGSLRHASLQQAVQSCSREESPCFDHHVGPPPSGRTLQGEASPLHLLAHRPRGSRQHPLPAQEKVLGSGSLRGQQRDGLRPERHLLHLLHLHHPHGRGLPELLSGSSPGLPVPQHAADRGPGTKNI